VTRPGDVWLLERVHAQCFVGRHNGDLLSIEQREVAQALASIGGSAALASGRKVGAFNGLAVRFRLVPANRVFGPFREFFADAGI
jgi:hypothetical protein